MPEYVRVDSGGVAWRVDVALRGLFEGGPFGDLQALLASGRLVKDLKVKRTVEVRAAGRTWLVKTYKPGSWLQRVRAKLAGSRAATELAALQRMLAMGLPTLPFAAAGHGAGGSHVVIESRADRVRLDELYARHRGTLRGRRLAAEYGRWARRFHEAGVDQYDFNPSNVLARREGHPDLCFIDFERVRYRRMSEEARLRALAKIARMVPASRADRWRFFFIYWKGEDLRRRWRRTEALTAAQVRRDAARLRASCVRENRNFGRFEIDGVRGRYRKRVGAGGVSLEELESAVRGAGGWRRVPEAKAEKAWREAHGVAAGERPVVVVFRGSGGAGELIYRA